MTPAKRTARACRLVAGLSTICAFYAAAWHPWYAVPGLVGAAILLLVAAAYQVDHIRQQARHEALTLACFADSQTLAATRPCCRFWEQPDGAHAADCRNSRSAA